MKRLFENVGGNNFKLLTESVDVSSVHSGIKKLFSNGDKSVSYTGIESIGVGMGFIKDVSRARKHALDEARKLAEEFNYTDVTNSGAFVKKEEHNWDTKDFSDTSEEKREVQIGKEILSNLDEIGGEGVNIDDSVFPVIAKIKSLAEELIKLHGPK